MCFVLNETVLHSFKISIILDFIVRAIERALNYFQIFSSELFVY